MKKMEYKAFFWSLVGIVLIIIYLLLTKCDHSNFYECSIHVEWPELGTSHDTVLVVDPIGAIEEFERHNTDTLEVFDMQGNFLTHAIQTCKCK